ncbi:MAG: hypothetical protein WBJ17_05950 [Natronincolaceae bacterium]
MGQDFLTLDNVGNFTFQLFAVVADTEFTKRFINKIYRLRNKENKCETEFIVLGHSLILSIIKTFSDNEISWCGSCEGFINIAVPPKKGSFHGTCPNSGHWCLPQMAIKTGQRLCHEDPLVMNFGMLG